MKLLPTPVHAPLRATSALTLMLGASILTGCQDGGGNSDPTTETAYQATDSGVKQPFENQGTENTMQPKTLVWSAPLTREDGSSLALGQIAEYKIYYRLKYKDRFNVIPITDTSNTRYPLKGLPPGAYEFAITTVDAEGLESRRSESVEINLI
ncbi:fibronectin type III domain-containing protein [Marinobacter sp. AL4B]|uniref:fibronectin type III domain-containing protein n=1 Tax=Marinobacter sp. AL4B TaxID=2871173 RepID=UPI001CAA5E4B|nr:fibronectin type III domain-containing protein [Marinobacter sp. AL4B]MBZ0335743.1 fibronectin type III domain-containing protein [Marinobacter sp. AL4B]